MSRYKIATKTDTLRYKIAKEVFNEIEDSDGVRDIPSWEIFEKCLEQHKRIIELEEQLKNAIVPKFKIGQEVWRIDPENDVSSGEVWKIEINRVQTKYTVFWGNDYEDVYFEYELFTTKEEAEAKLKELKGE